MARQEKRDSLSSSSARQSNKKSRKRLIHAHGLTDATVGGRSPAMTHPLSMDAAYSLYPNSGAKSSTPRLKVSRNSNISLVKSFVDSNGSVVLPTDDAAAQAAPRAVTRGRSLQSSSLPGSDAFGSFVVVDWLSFSLPVSSTDEMFSVVSELRLLFGGFTPLGRGFRGYAQSASILGGSGRLAWHPQRLAMGVHVDLPSEALVNFESDGSLTDVSEFLQFLLERKAKISRLDVAIDTDQVHISTVRDAVEGVQFVSRCTHVSELRRMRNAPGWTVYVGSSAARRRVRFYDKASEQGLNTPEKLQGHPPIVWTRAEIQHRDKYAWRAAAAIAAGRCDPAALFNEVLDFRNNDNINTSRRSRSAWWESWLGRCRDRVGFPFDKIEKSVNRVVAWLTHQVSPALAMLAVADPDVLPWLGRVIDEAFPRLDEFRRYKAHQFRQAGLCLPI